MAKSNGNIVVSGLSGRLGKQLVVRTQKDGDTVVSAAPRRVKGRKGTPAQQAQQERFRKAGLYGRAMKNLPEYLALAAQRKVSAFQVATSDYLRAPEILGVDISEYQGVAGQKIQVAALDDVKVVTVNVTLCQDDDTVIEKGHATVTPMDPRLWVYTATTNAPSTSVKIRVEVTDLPGNTTTQTAHT